MKSLDIMSFCEFYEIIVLIIWLIMAVAEFDLEKERNVLDEQGVKIADNQENSQKNRRKLAESTKGISFTRKKRDEILKNKILRSFSLLFIGNEVIEGRRICSCLCR